MYYFFNEDILINFFSILKQNINPLLIQIFIKTILIKVIKKKQIFKKPILNNIYNLYGFLYRLKKITIPNGLNKYFFNSFY